MCECKICGAETHSKRVLCVDCIDGITTRKKQAREKGLANLDRCIICGGKIHRNSKRWTFYCSPECKKLGKKAINYTMYWGAKPVTQQQWLLNGQKFLKECHDHFNQAMEECNKLGISYAERQKRMILAKTKTGGSTL